MKISQDCFEDWFASDFEAFSQALQKNQCLCDSTGSSEAGHSL